MTPSMTRVAAAFGSLPASACTLGAQGSFGPDRITKSNYDSAGQVTQVRIAVGTVEEAAEITSTYRPNGQVETIADGEGRTSQFYYDGHDRRWHTLFPHPTTGAVNPNDFERYSFDAAGNLTGTRLRDGNILGYSYDNLNRLVSKDVPGIAPHEYDITYSYDLLGRMTQALDSNTHVANFGYDALGRKTSEQSNWTTRSWQYDLAGRRTRLTWGDGFYVTYDYNGSNDLTAIRENGSLVLASFGHDDLGRRTSLTRGNGTVASYGYDGASRLASLTSDLAGTGSDLTLGFSYNPASQIVSRAGSNDAYAWTGHGSGGTSSIVNGLNQLTNVGGTGITHDARGNLTHDGVRSFTYTAENRLATASGGYVVTYDPLGRFHWIANAALTWMQYDGADLIEERNAGGVLRRYVHGPGVDEPLVWYEGSGTGDRRYLHADERGSIVAVSDSAGNAIGYNAYDEYGRPQGPSGAGTLLGRFGYTGQAWLPEIQLYYYKARMMDPKGGRFLQPDPIGYEAGMNLYAYVRNDPVNLTDPSGLSSEGLIIVTATKRIEPLPDFSICHACQSDSLGVGAMMDFSSGLALGGWENSREQEADRGDITVTARRPRRNAPNPARPQLACAGPLVGPCAGIVLRTLQTTVGLILLNEAADHRRGSRPINPPRGTRPIDKAGIGRGQIHDIKRGVQARPNDWVGITPDGRVITTNPVDGTAVDEGHKDDF